MIRDVDARDLEAIQGLHERAADYVALETGALPGPDAGARFLASAPPGGDAGDALRLGAFEGDRLDGLLEVAFGYPEAFDAYAGLLMLAPEARGQGLGSALLAEGIARALARGAARMLVAVLEANPWGLAFWAREGFAAERRFPAVPSAVPAHVRVRMVRDLRLPAGR